MRERNSYLIESKIDDEYARNYSSIDRDTFNKIIAIDPRSKKQGDEIVAIGFGAKQLLLPNYLKGETDFVNNPEEMTAYLNRFYTNMSSYPNQFKNLANFNSIADFKAFVDNPDTTNVQAHVEVQEDPLTAIYTKYYEPKGLSREDFNRVISVDPQTTDTKIGDVAKNLLLPKYIGGEIDLFTSQSGLKKISNAIERFYSDKDTYPQDKQNLNNYNSIQEFIDYKPESPTLAAVNGITEGVDYIRVASSRNYDVFKLLTFKGSETLAHARGADNTWCTAGGSNGHQYGFVRIRQENNAEGSTYWKCYKYENGYHMYEFLSKNNPTDRTQNYNLAMNDHGIAREFRDGNNSGDYNKTSSNVNEKFRSFLVANPDVNKALSTCSDPVLANAKDVVAVSDMLKLSKEPFNLSTNEDVLKLRSDDFSNTIKETIISIEEVPTGLFAKYNALESVTVKSSVRTIKAQAFKNCKNLKTLIIEDGLKIIMTEAFAGCESLKGSVRIPDTVTEIRTNAFADTHCQLKVNKNRTEKLKFAKEDETWVNSHVKGIQIQ